MLRDVLDWRLRSDAWPRIASLIESVAAAPDDTMLAWAIADLEALGPMRATRLGSAPTLPPPADVRERVADVIRALILAEPGPGDREPEAR
ncbi:hypothetical protein OG241_07415 [Streptomyces sp. NBC_01390]|uniref:CATRA system-associated protein n=1 Tax=Streptomyces sp. NBC_01390 TaxID=2903850 RepID=UPI003245628D